MNRISKLSLSDVTVAVFALSFFFCGCIGESKRPEKPILKAESAPVYYTCKTLADARPRVLATLRQAGMLEAIVKVATDSELLVIAQLSAKDKKTESIAKFATIVAAVAKFTSEGDLKVIFMSEGTSKGQVVSLSCKIANARSVYSGKMKWPDFLKTLEISSGAK